jgi:uncharacterized protein YuzE
MKKNNDKDAAGSFEGFFNPELLFCNDATVVDYLNALLESEPALNMDFREIHFVHQEIMPLSNSNTFVGNAVLFDAEYSKTEADELRSDNEKLKFKTELAEIDAQVLRTENNKLKIEKEHLIAQLLELKDKFNTALAEKESLRQSVELARLQIEPPVIPIVKVAVNIKTNSAACAEQPAEGIIDSEPEQTVQLEIQTQELQPEPETVIEECRIDDNIIVPIDQERVIIAGITVQNDSVNKTSRSDLTIFSHEKTTGVISRQNAQPVSKVIKHRPAEKNHPRQSGHIVRTVTPDVVPQNIIEADNRLKFVQQQLVAVVKNNQEVDATAAITVAELLKDVDEIDMPPAAEPKVVLRKNVKNYEDLQKESDSKKTTKTGHDLIL